ncbi:MAG: hypothetical protein HZC18_08610 [Candidatus Omnitrophica bacterium]|nr:hypothetical protein [Candidatus Omnitrophota bacterium]
MCNTTTNTNCKPGNIHSVHIPVMGTGFSIDTPIKVAQYGISSVISIVDDCLIEDMRKYHSDLRGKDYVPITKEDEDHRARRITAYLDLVDDIVQQEFKKVKSSAFEPGSEITKYFELLAEDSLLKAQYNTMLAETDPARKNELQKNLRGQMKAGSIDVNIMTKLDRPNYGPDKKELPSEYSDALAALRGYAQSKLDSAIVFSAGINRRLYSYIEKFKDFYADAAGVMKKRIILKVTDYRSSFVQGCFLAKKGLWVSEYRVESGLNCGGHAFVSDGYLMGPILEEFKKKKSELIATILNICNEALLAKNLKTFDEAPCTRITTQGGIGTAKENKFLLEFYQIDGTGWATPFLLCPEATNVDRVTLQKLCAATEDDIELSEISPLGVPFHNLKESPSELEKRRKIELGRPGSACPKGYLVSSREFTELPICTASRQYQKLKLDQLKTVELDPSAFKQRAAQIMRKSCICNDLAESPLITHHVVTKHGIEPKRFTAICPGPNIAYFSRIVSLSEMIGHIYGRLNLLEGVAARPNMFIKELQLNIEYFVKEVKKIAPAPSQKQIEYVNEFKKNLLEGIEYYRELFPRMIEETESYRAQTLAQLQEFKKHLENFIAEHTAIFSTPARQLVAA